MHPENALPFCNRIQWFRYTFGIFCRINDPNYHEDQEISPSKGKRKSNMADSSLVKTSASKPSPRERSTKWSKEATGQGDDDDDDVILPALVVPAVRPPASSKSKLYKSPEIFKDIDRRAVEVRVQKIFHKKTFVVFDVACYLPKMSVGYFGSRCTPVQLSSLNFFFRRHLLLTLCEVQIHFCAGT